MVVKQSIATPIGEVTEEKAKGSSGFVPTPKHPSRAVAGLLLAAHRHEDFTFIECGKVWVPSASQEDLVYTVDLAAGEAGTCTCPHWKFGSGYETAVDKHLVAAEFVARFVEAAPGVSYRVEERYEAAVRSRISYVIEVSDDWPHGRTMSHAYSFEGALWEIVELMADRIQEAA